MTLQLTPSDPWQSKYETERTKTRILGATTVAVSLLAVGLGAWGLNADSGTAASGPGQLGRPNATSQFAPPGQAMPAGPMGQNLASQLLNADGSVNTDAVAKLAATLPDGALEQMLTMAVTNGELTQDQADEIAAASTTQDT